MAAVLAPYNWDPYKGISTEPPILETALNRIRRDLMSIFKDPPPGIYVTASESDIRSIHALIIGPMDTPYEGGMFYFYLRCPYNYPIRPPKVKLMTTDAGKVRFNPNMYACGKVCLSIIGTWSGPGWTPAQQLSTLLISIQSLLNENPIVNEPEHMIMFREQDHTNYKEMITFQTIRVAVIGMVENECHLNLPPEFVQIIERTFLQYFDVYVETCTKRLFNDGRKYKDPLHKSSNVVYDYKTLLEKLHKVKGNIIKKKTLLKQPSSDGDGSDYKDDEDEAEIHGHAYVSSSDSEEDDVEDQLKDFKKLLSLSDSNVNPGSHS